MFMREVAIWKGLRHGNVLELFGASGCGAEDGPWFLVSPYLGKSSVVRYLKGVKDRRAEEGVDLLKMMHEIAKGMEYLHGQGVLHGDLKVGGLLGWMCVGVLIGVAWRGVAYTGCERARGRPHPVRHL
jgi:abelson tyrosine-protein kinase 1/abelson tyrosine-protein kinase 2